jgi:CRP-like cAMP-binding protein
VHGPHGEIIDTLEAGKAFGEMALLSESSYIRCANVVTLTPVSLAVLTLEDFESTMS